jgi:hypothetical protein
MEETALWPYTLRIPLRKYRSTRGPSENASSLHPAVAKAHANMVKRQRQHIGGRGMVAILVNPPLWNTMSVSRYSTGVRPNVLFRKIFRVNRVDNGAGRATDRA